MLLKTQEILLETQGNLFKTQDTGAFEHNQAPKNRTNKKPEIDRYSHLFTKSQQSSLNFRPDLFEPQYEQNIVPFTHCAVLLHA